MAIRFYDEAIYNKIANWVKDPKMKILKPSDTTRLFQIRSDQTDDKPMKLPIIALSRDDDMEIISTTKRPLTRDAATLSANEDTSQVLNGIPIKLTYQLDVYTRYFAEADEYVRNFIFNIINYPSVHIEIPYNNSKIVHDSTMHLEPTVSDNSNIPEKKISDQFTRMSLRFTVDDAYLFSVPFMSNWKIEEISDIEIIEE